MIGLPKVGGHHHKEEFGASVGNAVVGKDMSPGALSHNNINGLKMPQLVDRNNNPLSPNAGGGLPSLNNRGQAQRYLQQTSSIGNEFQKIYENSQRGK